MDVSIVNPFLNTTINLFVEMFNLTPEYGKPVLVSPIGNHRWEISGVIGIVGESKGVIVLRVTSNFARKLLQLSGVRVSEPEEIPHILREMIGEFVNIISGNALPELKGKNIDLTPPVVIQGQNHTISWPNQTPIVGVPFVTKYGPFEIQICIT